MRGWKASAIPACVLALAGCGEVPTTAARPDAAKSTGEGEKVGAARLEVTTPAFAPGEGIPKKHTGEGEDVSPALAWSAAPDGTREFAVICDDPDAPSREPWVHWVAWGVPGESVGLEEGVGGLKEGKTSWGSAGYRGPMPPAGVGKHRYFFKVYALGGELDLAPGATKAELLAAMKGHVLAVGELGGRYERK